MAATMSNDASAAMRVALDELLWENFAAYPWSDRRRSDSAFVCLFKDAFSCAESQDPYECDEPWGDEFSDFLLTNEIVQRYSTLCCSARGTCSDKAHAHYLLSVVPSSLRVAGKEAELGPRSLQVVQFFVTLVNSLKDDDSDDDDGDESSSTVAGEEGGEEEDIGSETEKADIGSETEDIGSEKKDGQQKEEEQKKHTCPETEGDKKVED